MTTLKLTRFEIRDSTGEVLAVSTDEVHAIALLRTFTWAADDTGHEVMLVPVDSAGIPVGRARRALDL